MESPSVDRQGRLLETQRHEDAAVGAVARLAAHPARLHRDGCPHHDDSPGALQLARNQAIEFFARCNGRIPPHGPALCLEHGDDRRYARLVEAGV